MKQIYELWESIGYNTTTLLKLWLNNFISNIDIEIYCEREDDIFEIDKTSKILTFHQIKCYAEGFGLNSPEIKSSLLNFYNLFLKYSDTYSGLFIFKTNVAFKPRAGESLRKWYNKQKKGDFSPIEFIDKTRKFLIDLVDDNLNKYLKTEIDDLKINIAKQKVIDFKEKIHLQTFEKFLEKIRWDFLEENDTDKSIKIVLAQIKSMIKSDLKFDKNINENLILGFLLNIVVEKSATSDESKRLLNNDLLQAAINITDLENKFSEKIRPEIIQLMNNDFQIIEELKKIDKTTTKTYELIEEIHKSVIKEKTKETLVSSLTNQVKNWFKAIGYRFENYNVINDKESEFIINVSNRRGYDRIFILCVSEVVEINHIIKLNEAVKKHNCAEGWVITFRRISKSVREKIGKESFLNLFCYTIDELIDENTDFSGYFAWLENEVTVNKIDKNYIQLSCKKDVFDNTKSKKVDSSEYTIEEYIEQWLDDPDKKHISVLGEFGTGKTWFTLHYAWSKLQEYKRAQEKGLNRPRIPILIPLRDFSKAVNIEGVFSEFFFKKHKSPIPTYDAFVELNKMGKLLLIFDGFDEMADRIDNQKMINNFWEIARAIADNSKVLLTCRNEHFPEAKKGRELLNAELYASTQHLIAETPQFEVLELLKFNQKQIIELLELFTTDDIVEKIVQNKNLIDLASRPLYTTLILDSLQEIEEGKPIDESRVHLYSLRKKFIKDNIEMRTFTSISDKIFFMCELSWEMLSTDNMSINYRLFPDRIRDLFGQNVKEQKDIDHWQYDMMGQTMLIRNDDGDYKPAHRSFLEFFVAYKFAAELGVLDADFIELAKHKSSNEQTNDYEWKQYFQNSKRLNINKFQQISIKELLNTFGKQIFSKAVVELLLNMVSINSIGTQNVLLKLLDETRNKNEDEVNFISSNIVSLLVSYKYDYFKYKDLSNLNLKNFTVYTKTPEKKPTSPDEALAYFEGTSFENTNLENANFGTQMPLTTGKSENFANTIFRNTKMSKFHFNDVQIDCISLNEKYNIVAIGSLVGSIVLLDRNTFRVIERQMKVSTSLAFSNDSQLLLSNSLWHSLVMNSRNLDIINIVEAEMPSQIGPIIKTNNNNEFFICREKNIDFVNITKPMSIYSLSVEEAINEISLSYNQKYLAVSGFDHYSVWDLDRKEKVLDYKISNSKNLIRYKVSFHSTETVIAVSNESGIDFIELETSAKLFQIKEENIVTFEFCNNGKSIVFANKDCFFIYDYLNQKLIKIIDYNKFTQPSEEFRHDGLRDFVIDTGFKCIYFITFRYVYCIDIDKEVLVNSYKHMWNFKNADFTEAKGIDKETAIQLQKNGAIINVDDYE